VSKEVLCVDQFNGHVTTIIPGERITSVVQMIVDLYGCDTNFSFSCMMAGVISKCEHSSASLAFLLLFPGKILSKSKCPPWFSPIFSTSNKQK
jgi:hypothetical protein